MKKITVYWITSYEKKMEKKIMGKFYPKEERNNNLINHQIDSISDKLLIGVLCMIE